MLFSVMGRAPDGMLCLVWDLVLQGGDRLLERVGITEELRLPNLEQRHSWIGLY